MSAQDQTWAFVDDRLMTPDMANFSGNAHGGAILKLLDQVAYACASRYAGQYVVTLSVDQVTFKQPIHVGELVTFLAAVNHVGRTSMENRHRWWRKTSTCFQPAHQPCYFSMVADEQGRMTRLDARPGFQRGRCGRECARRADPTKARPPQPIHVARVFLAVDPGERAAAPRWHHVASWKTFWHSEPRRHTNSAQDGANEHKNAASLLSAPDGCRPRVPGR